MGQCTWWMTRFNLNIGLSIITLALYWGIILLFLLFLFLWCGFINFCFSTEIWWRICYMKLQLSVHRYFFKCKLPSRKRKWKQKTYHLLFFHCTLYILFTTLFLFPPFLLSHPWWTHPQQFPQHQATPYLEVCSQSLVVHLNFCNIVRVIVTFFKTLCITFWKNITVFVTHARQFS